MDPTSKRELSICFLGASFKDDDPGPERNRMMHALFRGEDKMIKAWEVFGNEFVSNRIDLIASAKVCVETNKYWQFLLELIPVA